MRIGVDVGGTKIEGVALSDGGVVLARQRVATPRDYEACLATIADLVKHLETETQRRGSIGIGMPGVISPASGLVKNSNSVWLNDQPLARDLERRLGRSLRFANDANCFALSEATDGAAAGAEVVFGVIVGTGTGGGIALRGKVWTGPNAIAGEWGHNPLPWPRADESPGDACYCGRSGCIETFLSGPGMARDHLERTGQDLQPPAIAANAAGGDPAAQQTLARYADRMARALATVVNLLDPDVIVLGGGMSQLASLYTEVPKLWSGYVFSDRVDTRLRPPLHGDASGVRGAAWLWPRSEDAPAGGPSA